jgi:hypothetical protein
MAVNCVHQNTARYSHQKAAIMMAALPLHLEAQSGSETMGCYCLVSFNSSGGAGPDALCIETSREGTAAQSHRRRRRKRPPFFCYFLVSGCRIRGRLASGESGRSSTEASMGFTANSSLRQSRAMDSRRRPIFDGREEHHDLNMSGSSSHVPNTISQFDESPFAECWRTYVSSACMHVSSHLRITLTAGGRINLIDVRSQWNPLWRCVSAARTA